MEIYVGVGEERKQRLEGRYIDFSEFDSTVKRSSATKNPDLGWIMITDISGWYKNEIDEKLVGYVATGNSEKLNEYIVNHTEGAEKAKQYLSELRFDGDGVATKLYLDASGWSLLNVAATKGRPEMVDFLVQNIGMNVDTICYGVPPIYCCFPSMHDNEDNFSKERLEAARAFMDNGANLSHQITFTREGGKPSGLNTLHTACYIKNSALRHDALALLTEKMTDCNIVDNFGRNALHRLFDNFRDKYSEITPTVEMLLRKGVSPTQKTKLGLAPLDCLRTYTDKESFQQLVNNNVSRSVT